MHALPGAADVGGHRWPSIKKAGGRLHAPKGQGYFDDRQDRFDLNRQKSCYARAVPELNRQLRELRNSANPPISLEKMSQELGLESKQAYHFYESEKGFKQRYLPINLARRIAAVLADRGVNPDDVMALAGFGSGDSNSPVLTAGEQQLLDYFRNMGPEQRRLYLQLGDQISQPIVPAEVAAPVSATLHDNRPGFRERERA